MIQTLPSDYVICPPLADHPILENVHHQEDMERGYIWACRLVESPIKQLLQKYFLFQGGRLGCCSNQCASAARDGPTFENKFVVVININKLG